MAGYPLVAHPAFPGTAIAAIAVDAVRREADLLELTFRLSGDISRVIMPELATVEFTDELWRHTCCEAFVRGDDGSDYVELNIAPSMRWAAYAFDGYRSGMTPLLSHAPKSTIELQSDQAVVATEIRLPMLADISEWHLNLTTIIEETDRSKSYWALAHAPGPPDFHNPDCFIAGLPAPNA